MGLAVSTNGELLYVHVAGHTIDVIAEENLVEEANRIGAPFKDRLQALQTRYPQVIGEIYSFFDRYLKPSESGN